MAVRQIYTNLCGVIVIELFGTILINTIKENFDYISKKCWSYNTCLWTLVYSVTVSVFVNNTY